MKNKSLRIYYILFIIVLIAFIFFIFLNLFTGDGDNLTSLKFSRSELAIYLDDSMELKVNTIPEGDYKITYTSDNPNTVSVNENGVIVGLKMGTATITASHEELSDTCRVVVLDSRVPVTSVSLNKEKDKVFTGSEFNLSVTIKPDDASSKRVAWKSSDSSVLKVDSSGNIKALKRGTATITATSNNGKEASCVIDVVDELDLTVSFVIQDKKATNTKDFTKTCKINRYNSKCTISGLSVPANTGYEILGWSLEKNTKNINHRINDKITVDKDTTYYLVSKNTTPITVRFVVVNDTVKVDNSNTSCYAYNGTNSCKITLPKATGLSGNTFLGWSTKKDNYKDYHNGEVTINGNSTFYSVAKKTVHITYSVNENNSSNIKADKLSFTSNEHTKCESYNDNGCSINWIPAIYSKGHIPHGFSLTPDGKCISVYKSVFNADTILYARVEDRLNSKKISSYKASYEELYGNIILEIEYGIPSTTSQSFIDFIKVLYKDYPELFYLNGKVVLLTEDTYIKYNGNDSSGITWTDDSGYFSTIFIRYNSRELTGNRFLGTTVHEIGHGYNNVYNQIFGKHVSSQSDVISIYNNYKDMPSSSRPLSDYAYYGSSRTEFFSEALLEYYRDYKLKNGRELYKSEKSTVLLPDDIKEVIVKYLTIGKNYFKKIGRLS